MVTEAIGHNSQQFDNLSLAEQRRRHQRSNIFVTDVHEQNSDLALQQLKKENEGKFLKCIVVFSPFFFHLFSQTLNSIMFK